MSAASRSNNETILDPGRKTHLGIWRDEHDDITREFFRWDVPVLPQVCLDTMAAGVWEDLNGTSSRSRAFICPTRLG